MLKYIYMLLVLVAIVIILTTFSDEYNLPSFYYAISYIICGTSPLVFYYIKKSKSNYQ